MAVITDAQLLRRFREGDESSFETLFERHYDMVYGALFRLTGTRAEAEDLAQEVFLKLYRRPLRHQDNIAGWLYRVAMNTGYNALRTRQRRDQRERRAVQQADALPEGPPTPEKAAATHEIQTAVRAALAQIRPRSAKLLMLREMGFSYKEMAEIVNVAPGSVGTLLARAQNEFELAYNGPKMGEEGA